MKKNLTLTTKRLTLNTLLAVAALLTLASCDSKLCYCYERTSTGVYEQEVYTNTDTPCNSMSTETRGCIERNERGTFDPNDIAK